MHLLTTTPCTITHRDGTTARVDIAPLSIRNLYKFTRHLADDDTPALVALAAGKPPEWIDTLTDDSYVTLARFVINQNFPRAVTLVKADPVTAARLTPLIKRLAEAEKIAAQIAIQTQTNPTPGVTSNAPSSAPPPSASAEAIPTASST